MIREILAISKPLGGKAIMLIKSKKENKRRPRKLAFEMLEDLGISVLISLFIFCFFYFTAVSISENYLYMRGFILAEGHQRALAMWITGICVIAAVVAFLVLFLFMTGRRLSYLIDIINSIEKMEDAEEKFYITPEGNDELTKLAESINYLSESQNDIIRKEKEMKEKTSFWRMLYMVFVVFEIIKSTVVQNDLFACIKVLIRVWCRYVEWVIRPSELNIWGEKEYFSTEWSWCLRVMAIIIVVGVVIAGEMFVLKKIEQYRRVWDKYSMRLMVVSLEMIIVSGDVMRRFMPINLVVLFGIINIAVMEIRIYYRRANEIY